MRSAAYLVVAAALVFSGAAQAAPTDAAAGSLARQIALTAANAERGAGEQSQIRPEVQSAVQGLIVASGAEPKIVLAALDQAITTCRPITAGASSDWTCPASSDAYAALTGLRGVVLAALDSQEPSQVGGGGPGAFPDGASVVTSASYSPAP